MQQMAGPKLAAAAHQSEYITSLPLSIEFLRRPKKVHDTREQKLKNGAEAELKTGATHHMHS
jgi:hypothetical protein